MDLEQLTVCESARLIRSRKISPVDLLACLISRIEGIDPEIGAWVTIDAKSARAAARQCEAEASRGAFRGPLHGVPLGVKDIIQTDGLRTTMGSKIFEGFVPGQDARVVQKLKEGGAIVLGKTVTTEFALFDPARTRNPWNSLHSPGGSSSGSAAAVSARMCAAALGTQTVGSIGRPASYCGVVGLVPTAGRISRRGVFPASWTLDHVGLFSRSAEDARLLLSVLSESAVGEQARPERPRLGLVKKYFHERASLEACRAVDDLSQKLSSAGALVREVEPPEILAVARPAHMTILRCEAASLHYDLWASARDLYSPRVRALVESGMAVDSTAYLRALRVRRRIQRQLTDLFRDWDVLLTPGATGPAPAGLGTTGDPAMNGPWTLADCPSLTLPVTLSSEGLPLSVQLSVAPHREDTLLAVGGWCESVIGFAEQPLRPHGRNDRPGLVEPQTAEEPPSP